jgi:replication factor A1
MVKEGDQVYVENGYTQEFRGETSLNVGRYGKLKKL